jgi:hypothetical protein
MVRVPISRISRSSSARMRVRPDGSLDTVRVLP